MNRLWLALALLIAACSDSRAACGCTVAGIRGSCGTSFCAGGTRYQCEDRTATPIGLCTGTDAGIRFDAGECFCADTVEGVPVVLACGSSQCVAGSNYTCSTGAVSGLLIRTGTCTSPGGDCSSWCATCSSLCTGCTDLESIAASSSCTPQFQAYAGCVANLCGGDTSECLPAAAAFIACACPSTVTRLQSQAAACGRSVSASCGDTTSQGTALACAQSYAQMGCTAFSSTVCMPPTP